MSFFSEVVERQASVKSWFDSPPVHSGEENTFDFSQASKFLRKTASVDPDGSQCLMVDPEAKMVETDTKKMSARFLISAISTDRHGDTVVPQGCKSSLPTYAKNPRVFFGHKSNGFSVGSARAPDGMLAVDVADDIGVYSTCYFHGQTLESEQVFRLVDLKELETGSIGFMPILGERKKQPEEDSAIPKNQVRFAPWYCFRFLEWALYEWSIVAVPANGDCVAMRLSRGLGGKRLAPGVEQYLAPFAAPAKEWASGFGSPEIKDAVVAPVDLEAFGLKLWSDVNLALARFKEEIKLSLAPLAAPVVPVLDNKVPERPLPTELSLALQELLVGAKQLGQNQNKSDMALRRITGKID